MRNKSSEAISSEAQPVRSRGRQARLAVSNEDRDHVARLLATGRLRPGHERRLRIILLTAEGKGGAEIAGLVGISRYHVSRVRARFGKTGTSGLADRPRVGRKSSVSAEMAAQIVAAAGSPPPPGAQRWTLSLLASRLGFSRSVIYRILRRQSSAPREESQVLTFDHVHGRPGRSRGSDPNPL
jgi:transposase